jgi:hypothetical protein
LLRPWDLPTAPAPAIRNWGGALPMLRGIDATQIRHVLAEATCGEEILAQPRGEITKARERR